MFIDIDKEGITYLRGYGRVTTARTSWQSGAAEVTEVSLDGVDSIPATVSFRGDLSSC